MGTVGKFKNDVMSEDQIKSSHEYYLEVNSMKQTATWVREVLNLNVNRHNLARLFHKRDFYVAPPNGRQVESYELRDWSSDMNRLLAESVRLAWQDILDFVRGGGVLIDYASACHFVSQPLYEDILETLNRSHSQDISMNSLPKGVSRGDILRGNLIYERLLKDWVYDGIEAFEPCE